MHATRRAVTFGLIATALAGCGGGPAAVASLRAEPEYRAVPNPAFDAWLAGFRSRAAAKGITQATLDAALRDAGFLPLVIEKDRNQTESTRTLGDYLAITASDEKVATGRAKLAQHRALLSEVESRYGVDAAIVTAIWGVESNFGSRRGSVPVISALATLAHDGRRGPFFEAQLIAALRILQRGDVAPAQMTGSWAGAMGHTQFIPTSYEAYAVDFRGDGRRDIWSDDPTDALASTAAYLSRSGWRRGQPWVQEATGGATGGTRLQPQAGGPVFLVYPNFATIKRYNNSTLYAMGVGHLANRIGGAGPLRGDFGPDANGLRLAERKEVQQRLTAQGFDTQGSDGVIGPNSEAAIRAFQQARGLPVTGQATPALLVALR